MLLGQITVEIKKESDSIITDPGFIGSLVGSLIAGLIAVGILWYETRSRNKDSIFKSYGTMKVLAAKLTLLKEYERVALRLKENMGKHPEIRVNLCKALGMLEPSIENLYKFMERERGNIPYEFISRYHSTTNVLETTLVGFSYINDLPREEDIERVVKEIRLSNEIAQSFLEHINIYLRKVEKKYKIKDFY